LNGEVGEVGEVAAGIAMRRRALSFTQRILFANDERL